MRPEDTEPDFDQRPLFWSDAPGCKWCGLEGHISSACPNKPLFGPQSISYGGL
jgi:hypothetical protein